MKAGISQAKIAIKKNTIPKLRNTFLSVGTSFFKMRYALTVSEGRMKPTGPLVIVAIPMRR